MVKWSKDIAQYMVFTFIGIALGVLGNFMVVSYYRVADQMNISTFIYDLLTFFMSMVFFLGISLYAYLKIRSAE